MRTFSVILLSLFFSFTTVARKTIKNPAHGFSTAPYVNITSIEISDTSTTLSFHIHLNTLTSILIPKKTYIQVPGNDDKFFATGTTGIPFGKNFKMPKSHEIEYKVHFPKIDLHSKMIDYGEGNKGGSWFIYGIQLEKPERRIPEFIAGHWFSQETGLYKIAFLDTLAIYKGKIWAYGKTTFNKNSGNILLTNADTVVELVVKKGNNGSLFVGGQGKKLEACTHIQNRKALADNSQETFQAPLFHLDTATFSGYIRGYTPRMGVKTFSITLDDILTGRASSFLAEIQDNGQFSVKIPIYYPHGAFIKDGFLKGNLFLEPGKSLFQVIDKTQQNKGNFFMGESASINQELLGYNRVIHLNLNKASKMILDVSPAEGKTYCMDSWKSDLKKLNESFERGLIGKRAYQVHQADINYLYASIIMSYKMKYISTYAAKNKISLSEAHKKLNQDSIKFDYSDFITNKFANNPLALLGHGYDQFIIRLKNLEELRANPNSFKSILSDVVNKLSESGHQFTESEKETIRAFNQIDSISSLPATKEFYKEYGPKNRAIIHKYYKTYVGLMQIHGPLNTSISLLGQVLKATEDSLGSDVLNTIYANDAFEHTPDMSLMKELKLTYQDSILAFQKRYSALVKELFLKKQKMLQEKKLKDLFGIEPGLATDIMKSQDICKKIVLGMTPVKNEELTNLKDDFSDPFVPNYITVCNKRTIQKLEASKDSEGSTLKKTPNTSVDKLFEAIISKYKGKVVYVDFWATWCAPCRSGIQKISPLKEEMADKNITFVYITNPTSPENIWKNMAQGIKGEHYRVSMVEWNYLKKEFNIKVIPHYVLVGKDGEVINPHLGNMNNIALKDMLEKYIQE